MISQTSSAEMSPHRLERFLVVAFLVTLPLVNPWIRGDGVGYYAYARAPLIEHSLDFTRDYEFANESFRQERLDEKGQPRAEFRTATGHLENHFTVGPAMLWAPFLLLAHAGVLIARFLGSSVAADGFSAPYRYAMALATALYGFMALLLSFRLVRKYAGLLPAFLATLAIWWASSLPVYMYFNPSWSHAHSAFVVTLFLWYWDSTGASRTTGQWLVLGLITGLMLNVYYANLMVATVLVVEAFWQYAPMLRTEGPDFHNLGRLLRQYASFGAVVLLALVPTFATRWIVYGGPLRSGYPPLASWLWRSPVFLKVLFSSNHGLLVWTPVLAFSLAGLVLLAWRLPRQGSPFLAAAAAYYLFFTTYPDWAGISSFGNRFFVSLTALFILGLAVILERVTALSLRPRRALFASSVGLACLVLWNLGLMYQWGTHLIPARGPISFRQAAYNQFLVVPGQLRSRLYTYFFHRREMMQEIEQQDMQQLRRNAEP